jgi:integrase
MKLEARERVLSDEEIKYLWKAIDQGGGSDSTRRALKLMLVTGQRNNEICGMQTKEIQVGIGKPRCLQCRRCGWWIIPKERRQGNKGGKHMVFLSPLAMEIIGEHVGYIFPGDTNDAPIHGNSVNYHVRRNVEATGKTPYYGIPRWTPHDLRRTCATGVRRLGATRDEMDLILGHKVAGVTGVYDRYSGDQEKIKWLTAWGEYLRGILMPG